jgi:predicted enzyme related to lactoylglutathione lyase
MFRGLTTITYTADDVDQAVDWYREVLGIEPYFRREADGRTAYVEFRLGDLQHELGIMDRRFAPTSTGPGSTITFWAVDDAQAAYDRLLSLGAESHMAPMERGEGFVTASVVDPFGNIVGVMYNQHYLDVIATGGAG